MKLVSIIVVSALALLPFTANATDIPSKKSISSATVANTSSIDWSGAYLGVLVGSGSGGSSVSDGDPRTSSNTSLPYDINGSLFGGTVGYNMTASNNTVFGVEADYSRSSISGSASGDLDRPDGGSWGCYPGSCLTEIDWFATVRGRFGYTVDNLMIYGTGGLAVGRVHVNVATTYIETTSTNSGLVYGGGLEYRFDKNFSAKIEYLRTDLGWTEIGLAGNGSAEDISIYRFGLNYHF